MLASKKPTVLRSAIEEIYEFATQEQSARESNVGDNLFGEARKNTHPNQFLAKAFGTQADKEPDNSGAVVVTSV